MKLQQRLKELREENNLSQKELSKKINLSNVTLSQYESGKRKPDVETLSKLADFYNVTTDYLLGLTDNREFIINNLENQGVQILAREARNLSPDEIEVLRGVIQHFNKNK